MTTPPAYPLPPRGRRHFAPPRGFKLIRMTPRRFIDLAPPLGIDPESSDYIAVFVERIRDGDFLDAPELGLNHYHDGRHRAHAAAIAGVVNLPVYVDPRLVELLL